jgi:hypothetical protein
VLLAAVTPAGAPAVTRWQLASKLVADVRQLEQQIAAVEAHIKAAVAQSKTTLVGLFGVGPVLAVYRCLLADHAIVRPLDPAGGTRVRMGDGCSHGLVLQPHRGRWLVSARPEQRPLLTPATHQGWGAWLPAESRPGRGQFAVAATPIGGRAVTGSA